MPANQPPRTGSGVARRSVGDDRDEQHSAARMALRAPVVRWTCKTGSRRRQSGRGAQGWTAGGAGAGLLRHAAVRSGGTRPSQHWTGSLQSAIVESGEQLLRKSAWVEMKELVREAKAVVKISSLQIIVAQGVTGSFPWSALAFCPNVAGVDGVYAQQNWAPDDNICTGKLTWRAASPIFAKIVPERSRTSIYALDCSFESVLASFAPPVVGFLAEHVYGYNPVPYGAADNNVGRDKSNVGALAKALYTSIAIPMLLHLLPVVPDVPTRQGEGKDGLSDRSRAPAD
uniref:Uncharacterized protein n=1 Tax=Zea mays TaxID=4577 RepID=A0A804PEN1_MAIZE